MAAAAAEGLRRPLRRSQSFAVWHFAFESRRFPSPRESRCVMPERGGGGRNEVK